MNKISIKPAALVGWLVMAVFVAVGIFIFYSETGIFTYTVTTPSIGEKKGVMKVRVKNDNFGTRVVGDYTIKTWYGNITLKDKAVVNVREDRLSRREVRSPRSLEKITLKGNIYLREIYTDNFLSDTLQTDIPLFNYDKNTKLSSISGLEFNITSFIIYNNTIDFIIKGNRTFIIDEVEIVIPRSGAVLSIRNDEWILSDYASMDYLGISSGNNLTLRIIGKDYSSGASAIYLEPEWADVKKIRDGHILNSRYIDIDLVQSQLKLNEMIHELIRGIRKEE